MNIITIKWLTIAKLTARTTVVVARPVAALTASIKHAFFLKKYKMFE